MSLVKYDSNQQKILMHLRPNVNEFAKNIQLVQSTQIENPDMD